MALGARPADIIVMIVREGLLLTLAGGALGLAGAFAVTRAGASLLFGIRPADPVTFLSVGILVLVTALATCYVPARRAAGLDPTVALREE